MDSAKNIHGLSSTEGRERKAVARSAVAANQEPVDLAAYAKSRGRRKPQHLIGLLFAHGSRARRNSLPRTGIAMSVFTPCGKTAVKIKV